MFAALEGPRSLLSLYQVILWRVLCFFIKSSSPPPFAYLKERRILYLAYGVALFGCASDRLCLGNEEIVSFHTS